MVTIEHRSNILKVHVGHRVRLLRHRQAVDDVREDGCGTGSEAPWRIHASSAATIGSSSTSPTQNVPADRIFMTTTFGTGMLALGTATTVVTQKQPSRRTRQRRHVLHAPNTSDNVRGPFRLLGKSL
jgi:hypothetical protein